MKKHITALLTLALLASTPAATSANEDVERATNLRVEIWAVPQLDAIDLLDQARGKSDTPDIALELRKAAKSGKPNIKLIALPSITSRSGQRAKAVSGENKYVSSYKIDSRTEQEVPVTSTCLSGTSFEVDPVIGTDGVTMDINLSIQHALEDPVMTERTVVGPLSGNELKVQSAQENLASVTTSVTMIDGQTRLVGSIPLKNQDVLLVFLIAEIVKIESPAGK